MKIAAVVVCFHPDHARLRATCDRIIGDGVVPILVDNSEPPELERDGQFADCAVIANGENLGIARAQNLGVAAAVREGAGAVVFFDQDSVVAPGLIPALRDALRPGAPDVVAPVSLDATGSFEYQPTRVGRLGAQVKVSRIGHAAPYPVDIVISSGTMATMEALEKAGGMDEDLFIDFVDLEWCLRCRRHGVPIRVVPAAVMKHPVGGEAISLGFTTVLRHSPLRCYYQIRNSALLFRKASVPFVLAAREAGVLAVHKLLLLAAVPNRMTYLRAYVAGVRDGVMGVRGRRPGSGPGGT